MYAQRPPKQPELPFSELFIDESSQTSHDFLVLGGIIIPKELSPALVGMIAQMKEQANITKEMKWTRVSRYHLQSYKDLVDLFFDSPKWMRPLDFHSLTVRMAGRKEAKYNGGSKETGFNKEVYQIIQKFRRLYPGTNFHVYLDHRDSPQPIAETRTILNFGAKKKGDKRDWPFRRLHMRDSKKTLELQLVDVLLGGLAWGVNKHGARPDASPHKAELSRYILERAGVKNPHADTSMSGKYTVWHRRLR